ncbi:ankyrin-3-like isoform X3 [Gordionus sp. m RMFG-2023]|uniref:ankyrin-3-like isoform X3 n=1 Tax=Gordionus sp. m RMFG-2023 TaxID=3053472 RepID=UPI0031FD41D6
MAISSKSSTEANSSSFLRAARAGNLEKVLEFLKGISGPGTAIDINTSNANGLNALHLASKEGHTQMVAELLKRGANVNAATKKGNTALHIASLAGQFDIVKILIENGADVNSQSQNGFTPLYMAAQENHDSVVRYLGDNGANQTITTEDGFTPLAVALQQGHDKVVAVLLENENIKGALPGNGNKNNIGGGVKLPALHVAAKKDDCKAAELLLQNRSDPDVTSKSGFTPLHIAAHYGNQNIGQLFIDHGSNINFKARHDITPLHVAARWGKVNMVELLMKAGADINAKTRDGLTPLHCASRSGHDNVVQAILDHYINQPTYISQLVNSKTKNGLSPLHMASQGDHVKCAEILLFNWSPVDDITVDYLTSLHICAHYGNINTAELLLDNKAEVDARALNGFTPLHIACKKNRLKIVEVLLSRNATITCTTESGLTPLHVACFMGHMNVVVYLLNYQQQRVDSEDVIDVNAATIRGETALHLAARANQTDIMRILLRHGATVDCQARENQTPLHIASRLGNTDTTCLLLQHGASVTALTTDDYSPIHLAVKEAHPETLSALLERLPLYDHVLNGLSKKGFAPLHLAARAAGDQAYPIARILIDKGAEIDVKGKNDVTPLHVATHYDKPALVSLLLERGADPLAKANNGYTPLHIAAKKNDTITIAHMLVSALPGSDKHKNGVDAKSRSGFTPLHLATQAGNADMTEFLLRCGADPLAASNNGLTAAHLTAQSDTTECLGLLCDSVSPDLLDSLINARTAAGYSPLHTACHFGRLQAVRFLLDRGADPAARTTASGYTPLHQAAQQGHSAVVSLLLQRHASPDTLTNQGQTALSIAQKLGYVSLIETLKVVTETIVTTTTTTTVEEKYKVLTPETMQENYMSESEDEADLEKSFKSDYLPAYCHYEGGLKDISGDDTILGDHSYRYLTSEQMKSLGDDSIKLLDQEPSSRLSIMERSQGQRSEFSPDYCEQYQEEVISPTQLIRREEAKGREAFMDHPNVVKVDNVPLHKPPLQIGRLNYKRFLVSFMVDARGGAMRGCRHSGLRVIIPPRKAATPIRVTCRFVKPEKMANSPPLMEGEGLACRILELGPAGTKFLGPVIIEIPHFASLRGSEREITILRSDNGETWREHVLEASESAVQEVLNESFDGEDSLDDLQSNRITRILTNDFPLYFAIISRIHQETHSIGPEGGIISSTIVPMVQAMFPEGALTKRIRIGLQAHPISPEMVTKMLGNRVAVSPVVTIEPRRRKFHKPITLTIPLPQASNKGMINQYNSSNDAPTLRLLCSITGGITPAQWEDITGSTPLTFVNNYVSFTTTVSARFWLMDCRQVNDATKFGTEVYKEATHVPYMVRMLVFGKRQSNNDIEGYIRAFVITDDKIDKTLEHQERFKEIAQSRDVEVLDNKPIFLETMGNLIQITKSDTSRFIEDNFMPHAASPTNFYNSYHSNINIPNSGEATSPIFNSNLNGLLALNTNILALKFKPFQENRLPFKVRIKDPNQEPIGRLLFLGDPPYATLVKPAAHPICTLNIVLPTEFKEERMDVLSEKSNGVKSILKNIGIERETVFSPDLMADNVSQSLQGDWINLARELNFPSEDIQEIKKEFPDDVGHQAKAMFLVWKRMHSQGSDHVKPIKEMELALKRINRNDILTYNPWLSKLESQKHGNGIKLNHSSPIKSVDTKKHPEDLGDWKYDAKQDSHLLDIHNQKDKHISPQNQSEDISLNQDNISSPEIIPTQAPRNLPDRINNQEKLSEGQKIETLKKFASDTADSGPHFQPIKPLSDSNVSLHGDSSLESADDIDENSHVRSTSNKLISPTIKNDKKSSGFLKSTRKSLQGILIGHRHKKEEDDILTSDHKKEELSEEYLASLGTQERIKFDDEAIAALAAGKFISSDIIKDAEMKAAREIGYLSLGERKHSLSSGIIKNARKSITKFITSIGDHGNKEGDHHASHHTKNKGANLLDKVENSFEKVGHSIRTSITDIGDKLTVKPNVGTAAGVGALLHTAAHKAERETLKDTGDKIGDALKIKIHQREEHLGLAGKASNALEKSAHDLKSQFEGLGDKLKGQYYKPFPETDSIGHDGNDIIDKTSLAINKTTNSIEASIGELENKLKSHVEPTLNREHGTDPNLTPDVNLASHKPDVIDKTSVTIDKALHSIKSPIDNTVDKLKCPFEGRGDIIDKASATIDKDVHAIKSIDNTEDKLKNPFEGKGGIIDKASATINKAAHVITSPIDNIKDKLKSQFEDVKQRDNEIFSGHFDSPYIVDKVSATLNNTSHSIKSFENIEDNLKSPVEGKSKPNGISSDIDLHLNTPNTSDKISHNNKSLFDDIRYKIDDHNLPENENLSKHLPTPINDNHLLNKDVDSLKSSFENLKNNVSLDPNLKQNVPGNVSALIEKTSTSLDKAAESIKHSVEEMGSEIKNPTVDVNNHLNSNSKSGLLGKVSSTFDKTIHTLASSFDELEDKFKLSPKQPQSPQNVATMQGSKLLDTTPLPGLSTYKESHSDIISLARNSIHNTLHGFAKLNQPKKTLFSENNTDYDVTDQEPKLNPLKYSLKDDLKFLPSSRDKSEYNNAHKTSLKRSSNPVITSIKEANKFADKNQHVNKNKPVTSANEDVMNRDDKIAANKITLLSAEIPKDYSASHQFGQVTSQAPPPDNESYAIHSVRLPSKIPKPPGLIRLSEDEKIKMLGQVLIDTDSPLSSFNGLINRSTDMPYNEGKTAQTESLIKSQNRNVVPQVSTNEVTIESNVDPKTPQSSPKTEHNDLHTITSPHDVKELENEIQTKFLLHSSHPKEDSESPLSDSLLEGRRKLSSPRSSHFTSAASESNDQSPTSLHEREGESISKNLKIIKRSKTHTVVRDGQEETQTIDEVLYDDGRGNPKTFEELDPELKEQFSGLMEETNFKDRMINQDLVIEEIKDIKP